MNLAFVAQTRTIEHKLVLIDERNRDALAGQGERYADTTHSCAKDDDFGF